MVQNVEFDLCVAAKKLGKDNGHAKNCVCFGSKYCVTMTTEHNLVYSCLVLGYRDNGTQLSVAVKCCVTLTT